MSSNRYKLKFLKEKGFSLVEVMVSVALLGIVSLGGMHLVGEIQKAKGRGDYVLDISQFGNSLGRHLYSAKGCQEIKNKTFSGTFSDLTLTGWNYLGNASISKNTKLGKIVVSKLRAKQELSGLPELVVSGETLTKTVLEIEGETSFQNALTKFFYNIPVLSTASGEVKYCGDQKDVVEICNSLLGVFNSGTGRCEMEKTCKLKGTYKTLTCSPSGYACDLAFGPEETNLYTTTTSCPAGSVATQTASESWSHTVSCGKKCTQTINDAAVWFTCLECPP